MQILKTFIDGEGRRHKIGDAIPKEWDKPRLVHYQRHGMVGEAPKAKPERKAAVPHATKPTAPAETKPDEPAETKVAASGETVQPTE